MDTKISCAGWVVVVWMDDEIRTYTFDNLIAACEFRQWCSLYETHLMGW